MGASSSKADEPEEDALSRSPFDSAQAAAIRSFVAARSSPRSGLLEEGCFDSCFGESEGGDGAEQQQLARRLFEACRERYPDEGGDGGHGLSLACLVRALGAACFAPFGARLSLLVCVATRLHGGGGGGGGGGVGRAAAPVAAAATSVSSPASAPLPPPAVADKDAGAVDGGDAAQLDEGALRQVFRCAMLLVAACGGAELRLAGAPAFDPAHMAAGVLAAAVPRPGGRPGGGAAAGTAAAAAAAVAAADAPASVAADAFESWCREHCPLLPNVLASFWEHVVLDGGNAGGDRRCVVPHAMRARLVGEGAGGSILDSGGALALCLALDLAQHAAACGGSDGGGSSGGGGGGGGGGDGGGGDGGRPSAELLFDSNNDGLSFNRLLHAVKGYAGPTIVVLRSAADAAAGAPRGAVFGALIAEPLEPSTKFGGSAACCLFSLSPTLRLFRARSSARAGSAFVYLNATGGYDAPRGLGFGGSTERFRLFLDEDFEAPYARRTDLTYTSGPLLPSAAAGSSSSGGGGGEGGGGGAGRVGPMQPGGAIEGDGRFVLEAVEVWGLGGGAALAARQTQRAGDARAIAQARTVDKAAFLDDLSGASGVVEGKTFGHRAHVDRSRADDSCR